MDSQPQIENIIFFFSRHPKDFFLFLQNPVILLELVILYIISMSLQKIFFKKAFLESFRIYSVSLILFSSLGLSVLYLDLLCHPSISVTFSQILFLSLSSLKNIFFNSTDFSSDLLLNLLLLFPF